MSSNPREFGFLNPPESHCGGKQAFESRSLAQSIGDRRSRGETSRKLKPYRCKTCAKWHLASIPKGHPPVGIHRRPRLEEESTF